MDNKHPGSLTAIVGCMSSGKSRLLIRLLNQAERNGCRVWAFVPAIGTRSGASLTSRDGSARPAVAVATTDDLARYGLGDSAGPEVVGIDEVHFFDAGIVPVIERLVSRGVTVIVAGLNLDYRGQPFGSVPPLQAKADTVLELTANCAVCGRPATRNQRLAADLPLDADPEAYLGGDESYEPRCRDCHVVPRK